MISKTDSQGQYDFVGMKNKSPKIKKAVIPYISGITAFHSAGFSKKPARITHLTRYTVTRLFVPHW